MKRWLKRIGLGLLTVIAVVALTAGIYAKTQVSAFDESMARVYEVPIPAGIARSTDPAVIARGKHLAESFAGCALTDCHGADLGGGRTVSVGPLGTITAPNISRIALAYSDGELARLIRHGLKKDGRGVRLMPAQDFNFLPDSDVVAIISWVRTIPPVDKPNGLLSIGVLGKVMDRRDAIPFDVARRISHENIEIAGAPEPTPAYGKLLARSCTGCHGAHYSGGPIPGAPPDFPVPLNLTPDPSGLAGWTFEEFDKLLTTGTRKNGKKLDPFMPYEGLARMDETEKHALFAFLQTLPPVQFGNR